MVEAESMTEPRRTDPRPPVLGRILLYVHDMRRRYRMHRENSITRSGVAAAPSSGRPCGHISGHVYGPNCVFVAYITLNF